MHAIHILERPFSLAWRAAIGRLALAGTCLVLAACGGSADAPPPPSGVGAVPPTITQQPTNLSVMAGQSASFTVAATGTAPLAYQWQRNGVAIEGATATTYTLATTALADSGTVWRAVVTNAAGSATSNNATLTVTVSAPVLTITQQPASTSVVAGTQAAFSVAATCNSGTLGVRWQRSQGAGPGLTWGDIAGATALGYSVSTAVGDSGTQFRAMLDCSGQSATASQAAVLTVTSPGAITLSLLPIVGLRDQAAVPQMSGIDQDPAGSFTFITSHRVMRLSADLTTIDLVAGGISPSSADGASGAASFNQPQGLTQDAAGNVYVADTGNHTIRRIAPNGTVSTLAGMAGNSGSTDASGSAARFNLPSGIALGPDGDLYVADRGSHLIRRVTPAGVVTTYAGSSVGYADAAALSAQFNNPWGVAVAANGDVLIADAGNHRIRRIVRNVNAAGPVQTLAGNGSYAAGPDGVGAVAVIGSPRFMVLRGNTLTVRDNFGLLRQIDLTSAAVTTLTGSRSLGEGSADGSTTTARLRDGAGVTGAAGGGFMLADDNALRSVSAAGAVRTIASSAAAGVTPTGVGTLAQMPFSLAVNNAQAVVVDPAGNVVISDSGTRTVRRISPAGVVTLAAGLTGGFYSAIDGVASEAQFGGLGYSIASDAAGVLYVADQSGLRRIGTDNAVTQHAGSATAIGAVDGNAATARFNTLFGLAIGPGGNIFAADANNAVRRIDAGGNVTTYAGAMGESARVDGPIATARFKFPGQVAFAPDGALHVVERIDGVIRRIAPDGSSVSTLTGPSGVTGGIAFDSAGTLYYGSTSGLMMLPAGGTSSLLIQQGAAIVLGSVNPRLLNINGLAILGPKQFVILSGAQILKATLP